MRTAADQSAYIAFVVQAEKLDGFMRERLQYEEDAERERDAQH